MLSLSKRRTITLLLYLYDLLRGRISQPELLSKIGVHVPRPGARKKVTFHLPKARTNLMKYSILTRACRTYNALISGDSGIEIDIFHQTRNEYRKGVTEALR